MKSVHHFSSDQAINLAGTKMLVKVVQLQWRLRYGVCHLTKFLKSLLHVFQTFLRISARFIIYSCQK